MRQKINEDPRLKMGIVIVLALASLFLLKTRVMGGEEAPATTPAAATTAVVDPAAAAPVPGAAVVPSPTDPLAGAATPSTVPSTAPVIEGVPLPTELVSAYNRGDTVLLLLVREGGIDDALVQAATQQAATASGATLFTDAVSNVARYTQITQAINLDRVPALVVLRPKRLTAGTATATVSYGFRDVQSVQQEITDALFNGRTVGYSPD